MGMKVKSGSEPARILRLGMGSVLILQVRHHA
jgi:hypothetical protein